MLKDIDNLEKFEVLSEFLKKKKACERVIGDLQEFEETNGIARMIKSANSYRGIEKEFAYLIADIIDRATQEEKQNIFTMLRKPVERLLVENENNYKTEIEKL